MLTLETPVDHGPRDDWLDGERADLLIDLFGGDVSDFSDVSRFKLNGVVEKSSWLDENTVDEVFGVVLGQRKLDLEVLGLARLVIPNAFQASETRNSRLFQRHANRSVSAPRLFPGLLELLSKNPRSRIPARGVCVCDSGNRRLCDAHVLLDILLATVGIQCGCHGPSHCARSVQQGTNDEQSGFHIVTRGIKSLELRTLPHFLLERLACGGFILQMESGGLTWERARLEASRRGENRLTPPINCPAWICCILPCLLSTRKMRQFAAAVPESAVVLREHEWTEIDAVSLVVSDIVRLREGDAAPADLTILHKENDFVVDSVRAIFYKK